MNGLLEQNGLKKTANNRGFMHPMTWPSLEFVQYANQVAEPVLDIGCAYGVASLEALKRGATVYAVDACDEHLHVLEQGVVQNERNQLYTQHALFPKEVSFKPNFFDAILMSHVLQYLNGEEISEGFAKVHQWLNPGGKLFIVTYTPYHQTLKKYIPVYEEKKRMDDKWPGLIKDKHLYNGSPADVLKNMPAERIHLFDVHTITRELERVGFIIERAEMFGGIKQGVPEVFVLDGYEMLGVIAKKR